MQRRLTDVELKDVSKAEAEIRQLAVDGLIHLQDPLLQTLTRMLINGTTDGRPYVDPPLTDEDARQRPWVMVKTMEASPWQGPFVLIRERDVGIRYIVENHRHGAISSHTHVRRATSEEIAAAGLEVAE
jgi:hypothetical protein